MLSFALLATMATREEVAKDYFPVAVGTVWVYDEAYTVRGRTRVMKFTNIAEPQEESFGTVYFPVSTQGAAAESKIMTYHTISDEAVSLAGTKQGEYLETPYPIFKLTASETSWSVTQNIDIQGVPTDAKMAFSAKRVPPVKFMEAEHDAVQVTLKIEAHGPGYDLSTTQISVYAKGIGLFRTDENGKSGKEPYKRQSVLKSMIKGGLN